MHVGVLPAESDFGTSADPAWFAHTTDEDGQREGLSLRVVRAKRVLAVCKVDRSSSSRASWTVRHAGRSIRACEGKQRRDRDLLGSLICPRCAQYKGQSFGFHRFGEVGIKAGLDRAAPIFFASVTRQGDQAHSA